MGENFSESIKLSIKKSPKLVTFYSMKNLTKIGEKLFTNKSENFSESIKFSIIKSPKFVTFYSMKISQKFVKNYSPKKVKILVKH